MIEICVRAADFDKLAESSVRSVLRCHKLWQIRGPEKNAPNQGIQLGGLLGPATGRNHRAAMGVRAWQQRSFSSELLLTGANQEETRILDGQVVASARRSISPRLRDGLQLKNDPSLGRLQVSDV